MSDWLTAAKEALKHLVEENLFIRGSARGASALRALLRSWRRRDEFGLVDDTAIEEAIRLASEASVARLATDRVVVAGRPAAAKIDKTRTGDRYVVIRWPSGLSATWTPPEKFWKMRVLERFRFLFDILVAELEEKRRGWVVTRLASLKTRGDAAALERALDIVAPAADAANVEPEAALAALFLSLPPVEAVRPLAYRALLMLSGSDVRPVHVAEVSSLGTLKSSYAALLEAYLPAWRLTEWPTAATLLGDGNTGRSRLSGISMLFFDEFTKWNRRRGDNYDIWSAVANGMASCKWERAAGGEHAPSVPKCISTYWMGNPTIKPLGDAVVPPSEHVRKFFDVAGMDGENLASMMSRLAIWGWEAAPETSRRLVASIHEYVPRPGVVAALWERVSRQAANGGSVAPPSDLDGDARIVERYKMVAVASLLAWRDEHEKVAAETARGLFLYRG